ncbi:MAG: tryptophan transporter [Firmicutes bacterium]|nr:tryptophan transporter [Bacillota bacterium]
MRVGDLVLAGLLVGLGLILHGVFPGVFAGMKPDFSLIMLFIILMIIPDRRIALVAGLATAVITALTTSFPNGQIANIVDKIVTTVVVMGLTALLPKQILVVGVGAIGTLVSGVVFLGTAAWLSGLPASFASLMAAVVLPAAGINTIALLVLYPLAAKLYAMQTASQVSAP